MYVVLETVKKNHCYIIIPNSESERAEVFNPLWNRTPESF